MSAHSAFEPVKFKLSGQIQTHSGPTDELVLNMPTAGAFIRYGSPLIETSKGERPNVETRYSWDYKIVMAFVKEMTGLDDIILSTIPGNDMLRLGDAVWGVLNFRPKPIEKAA